MVAIVKQPISVSFLDRTGVVRCQAASARAQGAGPLLRAAARKTPPPQAETGLLAVM